MTIVQFWALLPPWAAAALTWAGTLAILVLLITLCMTAACSAFLFWTYVVLGGLAERVNWRWVQRFNRDRFH